MAEVTGDGYTIPQQHHHLQLVQPKHANALIQQLVKKAVAQVTRHTSYPTACSTFTTGNQWLWKTSAGGM